MSTKKSKVTSERKLAANPRWCIVGNGNWGLWFGEVRASDAEIARTKAVRLYQARSIRYWYGRHGGITSLAAYGLCGPSASQSRIGAPIASTLVLDVRAVHDCSAEAVETFRAMTCHER